MIGLLVWLLALPTLAAEPYSIRERPISFSPWRLEATQRYCVLHYGEKFKDASVDPKVIVLHWTGMATLERSWKAFDPEKLPPTRGELAKAGDVNVSAHFLVDRDGTIYRLMPETRMARHTIGLNPVAIGVENVGGASDKDDLTPEQADADAWLVRFLKERHPGIEYLIGHHEYLSFKGSALWLEKDPAYKTIKQDPGARFLRVVRARLADLKLKDRP
jgi:N-acetyl-anhydromuramyl-L-alanine amidase AmpD